MKASIPSKKAAAAAAGPLSHVTITGDVSKFPPGCRIKRIYPAIVTGYIFGLAFLYCVPKKFSKLLSQYFSLCCAITSISLYFLFKSSSELGKISGTMGIVFFILLSIRFGFWFYSRVIRASNASGQEQSIAWVELGYYSGMILGLIFWKLFKIEIDLSSALIVDATFLLLSSLFDFKAYSLAVSASSKLNEQGVYQLRTWHAFPRSIKGEYFYDNIMINTNVIEEARKSGVEKFIFAASAIVVTRMSYIIAVTFQAYVTEIRFTKKCRQ
jgi:hypothetical protein